MKQQLHTSVELQREMKTHSRVEGGRPHSPSEQESPEGYAHLQGNSNPKWLQDIRHASDRFSSNLVPESAEHEKPYPFQQVRGSVHQEEVVS